MVLYRLPLMAIGNENPSFPEPAFWSLTSIQLLLIPQKPLSPMQETLIALVYKGEARRAYIMGVKMETMLGEVHSEFERIYGQRLEEMLLFGSNARGDALPGSDVDLLVVLKGEVNPGDEISRSGQITAQLSLKYDVVLSCTFISASRFALDNSPLLLNIRREGLRL